MAENRYFRRKDPGPMENWKAGLVAGALSAAVASVSFYLTRVLLSRESMEPLSHSMKDGPPPASAEREGRGRNGE